MVGGSSGGSIEKSVEHLGSGATAGVKLGEGSLRENVGKERERGEGRNNNNNNKNKNKNIPSLSTNKHKEFFLFFFSRF